LKSWPTAEKNLPKTSGWVDRNPPSQSAPPAYTGGLFGNPIAVSEKRRRWFNMRALRRTSRKLGHSNPQYPNI